MEGTDHSLMVLVDSRDEPGAPVLAPHVHVHPKEDGGSHLGRVEGAALTFSSSPCPQAARKAALMESSWSTCSLDTLDTLAFSWAPFSLAIFTFPWLLLASPDCSILVLVAVLVAVLVWMVAAVLEEVLKARAASRSKARSEER